MCILKSNRNTFFIRKTFLNCTIPAFVNSKVGSFPGTKELLAWKNMSQTQQTGREEKARKKLLENADIRGL